jgi:plastocyanin
MVRLAVILLVFAAVVGTVGIVAAARDSGGGDDEDGGIEVHVTASGGFDPQTVTVDRGDTVTWVNDSGDDAWPASDVHPTHQLLPGFDPKRVVTDGESWSYRFGTPGRHTYHNHLAPENKGVVVVR